MTRQHFKVLDLIKRLTARAAVLQLGNRTGILISAKDALVQLFNPCTKTVILRSGATKNLGQSYHKRTWTHHPRPLAPLGVTGSGRFLRQCPLFQRKSPSPGNILGNYQECYP